MGRRTTDLSLISLTRVGGLLISLLVHSYRLEEYLVVVDFTHTGRRTTQLWLISLPQVRGILISVSVHSHG